METDFTKMAGLCLSFIAAFLLSLFHISLGSFSKISLSRLLEDKDKEYRLKILSLYDEIKTAVEALRIFFIIAFVVYIFITFPRMEFWPLWLFLSLLAVYLIFFDFVPRLLNLVNKDRVLGFFLPSFGLIHILSFPIFLLTRKMVQRKDEDEEVRETTDEEIETFIDEAKEEGIIEKDEDELLRGVVEFGDTVVREIMTSRVDMVCIRKDATIEKLREVVIKEKFSRIPVYKDRIDNIEGIIIAKDLLQFSEDRHKNLPIDALIRPVFFVPESMKVAELLKELQVRKKKLAIVVDEHGGVSGMVTMEDLVEEIVGEIQDEYDLDEAQITENAPADFTVSGEVEVEEVEEIFDLDLAEDDYITISGLITHDLGRLPKKGESFLIKGLSVEILDVDQRKIIKLRLKKPAPPQEKE